MAKKRDKEKKELFSTYRDCGRTTRIAEVAASSDEVQLPELLPASGDEDDPSDRKEIEATEDAQCGTAHRGELKRRREKRRREKRERRLVRVRETRRGVVLVRVHAANYERSEGAKQCVVFHPQVPPNNIRRNFFFPHSVNSTFF